ncbi:hypothetical protein BD560DRAFT_438992 [Blakeslea trispora]|nr:hypothetical protein BD560DRAFT_438992 [Blakeslea trispora]
MNKWDEDTMLQYVDNCFEEELQFWCMNQDFKSWEEFKVGFGEKFSRKVSLDEIVNNILNFKMNQNENKIKIMNDEHKKTKASDKNSELSNKHESIEFVITDVGFIKYFIKEFTSKGKIFFEIQKPIKLEDTYELLQEVYGSNDETDEEDEIVPEPTEKFETRPKKRQENDIRPEGQSTEADINQLISKF